MTKLYRFQKVQKISNKNLGIVSLLIGYKGRQVNKIMEDSGSQVNVNHPIGNLEFRPVTIKGASLEIIINAIKQIILATLLLEML